MVRIGQLPAIARDAIGLSLIVVVTVLLPAGVGLIVDKAFGTVPWATLIGALGGISAGTIGVVRLILRRFEQIAPRDAALNDRDALNDAAVMNDAVFQNDTVVQNDTAPRQPKPDTYLERAVGDAPHRAEEGDS